MLDLLSYQGSIDNVADDWKVGLMDCGVCHCAVKVAESATVGLEAEFFRGLKRSDPVDPVHPLR